ncbi:kinase-like domain-containing protein [Rhizophagus irregularis DAOM 181602=DAOM 197198]|nr:kinase-like domain-containing protein [Rhizophagus irregularis DAOM 181602=DAOM 197198]
MYKERSITSSVDIDELICKECNEICIAKRFQQNFKNWTSGNNDIDKIIQDSQLSDHYETKKALEWIPYDRFHNIKYIAKGGFGKVYKANWIDGPIDKWSKKHNNWIRKNNKDVALKKLNNSKKFSLEFMSEIVSHHKLTLNTIGAGVINLYGITQDPETKDYMMVLDYAEKGSLRNYLDKYYNKLSWYDKIHYLCKIAFGIDHIHDNKIIHRDLHVGNILLTDSFIRDIYITDMGLCILANYNASEITKEKVYGVLSYIAPEILRGHNYTEASDIYSFDANPLNRPTATEIKKILMQWWVGFNNQTELQDQIREADEINKKLSTNRIPSTSLELSYKTHSEAIYTSRLLDFENLPEPKNSDDYYEHYDNIVSMEYLESQQIDISQLKFNKDEILNNEFKGGDNI